MIGAIGKYIASGACLVWLAVGCALPAVAQESICARVKIEIKQELTLERQAFDAEMRITNSLPATALTQVEVLVKVTDETGAAVSVTTDPNDLTAKFFIRQTRNDVAADGQVSASSTAVLNWLLIPAPGSAGNTPAGKRYFVGATLRYMYANELQEMQLNPDAITVKPMPSLTLDYFLTRDVIADDPMTTEIEAPEPYTLGVRVKNSGLAQAKALKIDSAQPKIVENEQGLAVNFMLLGSYVQDAPVANTLLIDFGDIAPNSAKMGRWVMESNLAGKFVEFNATFTHADELGGALTSLLEATNAHLLVRDVRVDLPGRDVVRDFLAVEGSNYRLYESEGVDSDVADRSNEATLSTGGGGYQLNLPASQGFFYVRKPDPYQGQMALASVLRGDAKQIAPENVWLSKSKNSDTKQWEYWFNVFDVNSPGSYQVGFKPLAQVPAPPVLQFIPDRVVKETEQVSFLVEASSPMGRRVAITASPLPTGALLQDQGDGTAVFDWTPEVGQAGSYTINYTANDGTLIGTRLAKIRVDSKSSPAGPAIPRLVAPLAGAEVATQRPWLRVQTGEDSADPTATVLFEVYADSARTLRVAEGRVTRNPTIGQPTEWQLPADLDDNTRYYWRAQASSGDLNSQWVNGEFFVNLFNDAPRRFNLRSPAAGSEVTSVTPILSANNAEDLDEDVVTYVYEVYADSGLATLYAASEVLPAGELGFTEWLVSTPLLEGATYYWRVIATDEHGARTGTALQSMTVNTGALVLVAPKIVSPSIGGRVTTGAAATLTVREGEASDGSAIQYVFELDTTQTFDSSSKQISPAIPAGSGIQGSWQTSGLIENQRYYWRARTEVGTQVSDWVQGSFLLDAQNEAPSVPRLDNPGVDAWISNSYPTLSVFESFDPEGDTVSYDFEVYSDTALTQRVVGGSSTGVQWRSTSSLSDGGQYYWRARARDNLGMASNWSEASVFRVNTGVQAAPTISVTQPRALLNAGERQAVIEWRSTDPAGSAHVALYYDKTGGGFAGTKIAEGLSIDSGSGGGRYVWNMAGLPPGAYYVYGVIYDDKNSTNAYAPGTLVIPDTANMGNLIIKPVGTGRVNEGAKTPVAEVSLASAPTSDVIVMAYTSDAAQAKLESGQIVFTPQDWRLSRRIWIVAVKDNIADGDAVVEVGVGSGSSLDPRFMGLPGKTQKVVIVDDGVHTDASKLTVVSYQLTSKTYSTSSKLWTYRYRVEMRNAGPRVNRVLAKVKAATGYRLQQGSIEYGAIATGESVFSTEEIVLTSSTDFGDQQPQMTWELKSY